MGELNSLDLINETLDRLSLARTSSILSDDAQIRQILSFCHEAGNDIAKKKYWPELTDEFVIEIGEPTTLAASCTAGDATVTVASTAVISAAGAAFWSVTGDNVQIGCRVASVTSATVLELTETVDATQVADLVFTQDTFSLPTDWLRDMPNTAWDRRNQWSLLGPITPQRDQMNRSGIIPTGPRRMTRTVGYPKAVRIWPPPSAAGDSPGTLSREYQSKFWVAADDGTRKRRFTLNDDVHVWDDDEMLIDGIRWRYWQLKGLPYEEFRRAYYEKIDEAIASAEGGQVLSLGRRRESMLISAANVQDGSFPDRSGVD